MNRTQQLPQVKYPPFSQLKYCASALNAQFKIRDAPDGIVRVQQSIESRLKTHIIHNFRENGAEIPDIIKFYVKLTGDGMQVTGSLTVINLLLLFWKNQF